MPKIKNIIFDLGGVVTESDENQAVERFKEIGLKDADKRLDKFLQPGIFGQLEEGKLSAEEFLEQLGKLTGRKPTFGQCEYAWRGYCKSVPQRNLDMLSELRKKGYRVLLLTNNNPFMMSWARSKDFDGHGISISHYFDKMYVSYEMKMAKPSREVFLKVLSDEKIKPEETIFVDDSPRNVEAAAKLGIRTLCPCNNEDWTAPLGKILEER